MSTCVQTQRELLNTYLDIQTLAHVYKHNCVCTRHDNRDVVAILPQKALLMCPYVSSGNFWVLAPRCSRALVHNLQPTSDRCLIFASYLATGMISALAIISRLLCRLGTRGSFKYFPKNALLSFCRNTKSAVHVPYASKVIYIFLLCPSLHTWFQKNSVINPSVVLQHLHHALMRCLILMPYIIEVEQNSDLFCSPIVALKVPNVRVSSKDWSMLLLLLRKK